MLTIRDADEEDIEDILSLLEELGYSGLESSILDAMQARSSRSTDRLLVAVMDGTCVGFASIHIFPYLPLAEWICRITAMVVKSEYRRQGIGSNLLREVERIALEEGCGGIEITAAVERKATHAIYLRKGYRRTSFRFFKELEHASGKNGQPI